MRPASLLATCLAALALAATAHAAPVDYAIDPVHTRVAFRVSHAGFSRALGTFAGATGTLRFDPDDTGSAALRITVPVATLDLGDADWNRKVLDGTFLDADALPQATFASTAVEKLDADTLKIAGDLTLRGVTRPVFFEATLNAIKRHPLTFRRTIGFSATLRVSRKDFGLDAWPSVIGDEVEILVELEATRVRAANDDDAAGTPDLDNQLVDPPRAEEGDDAPDA